METEIVLDDEKEVEIKDADIEYSKQSERTLLSSYINQAKKYKLLTREEEYEIAIKIKGGDKKARDLLINSNLLLVIKIANEYSKVFFHLMDLIQEGNTGLLRSIEKYDPDRGYRFNTYAGWWIRSMILRYMFNNSHMIKPATTNEQKKLFYNLRKEQKRLESLGIDADSAVIAQNLNVSEDDVVEMDARLQNDLYLDSPIDSDEDTRGNKTFCDCLMSPEEEQPDKKVESNNYNIVLRNRLDKFALKLKTDRHREIFYSRIIAQEPLTLQQLGDKFGLTKERIRQQEEIIKDKLKFYLKKAI